MPSSYLRDRSHTLWLISLQACPTCACVCMCVCVAMHACVYVSRCMSFPLGSASSHLGLTLHFCLFSLISIWSLLTGSFTTHRLWDRLSLSPFVGLFYSFIWLPLRLLYGSVLSLAQYSRMIAWKPGFTFRLSASCRNIPNEISLMSQLLLLDRIEIKWRCLLLWCCLVILDRYSE